MKRLALAAAIATAFVAAPSFASSASSATLGPLVVTLHDLDPMDGITSSITFAPTLNGHGSWANTTVYQSTPSDVQYQSDYGTNTWTPVAASATLSQAWASASLAGSSDTNGSGTVLTASGGASNPVSSDPYDYAAYRAETYVPSRDLDYYQGFILSANTLVTFSALSTVSGHTDPYHFGDGAGASAETGMHIFRSDRLSGNVTDSLSGYAYGGPGSRSFSDSRTLQVSFTNATAQDLSVTLMLSAYVDGRAYAVTAVPEPETYAMLLAGLGLIGSMVRRKKKQG